MNKWAFNLGEFIGQYGHLLGPGAVGAGIGGLGGYLSADEDDSALGRTLAGAAAGGAAGAGLGYGFDQLVTQPARAAAVADLKAAMGRIGGNVVDGVSDIGGKMVDNGLKTLRNAGDVVSKLPGRAYDAVEGLSNNIRLNDELRYDARNLPLELAIRSPKDMLEAFEGTGWVTSPVGTAITAASANGANLLRDWLRSPEVRAAINKNPEIDWRNAIQKAVKGRDHGRLFNKDVP